MHHYLNSFISISFGAFNGVLLYINTNQVCNTGLEGLKVLLFGILGGIGGYIGKLIIQRLLKFFKS